MKLPKLADANPVLVNLLSDISCQPSWRGRAAEVMAWRYSEQWTKAQTEYITSLGLNPFSINLMAPAMDAVTGHESKNRVDWMVTAASEEQEDMAEAANHELNDSMRLADANQACSDAYDGQAAVGIGWVYVGRNPDPLSPSRILVEDVHRDEMFWDMRARSATLKTDCRWMARRKFFDNDAAIFFLGDRYKELIEFTFSDYRTIDIGEGSPQSDWLATTTEYSSPIELIMDNVSDRKRVAIYQVFYKVFEKHDLIITQLGHAMQFNKENLAHLELLAGGQAYIQPKVPITVCRVAWYLGPHLIWDGPSSEPHRDFPFVPFFGPRKDSSNTPIGLLERMMGPQEQYNRAAIEIQRILRSRRIEKDKDALHEMTDEQAVYEVNRTDGVINLKPNRRFDVVREWDKIGVLEGICQRSRDEVNAASGIYQTFQGQTEKDQSGIAVENIASLGEQSLGKINSNYQLARKQVGELAFYHNLDQIGNKPKMVNIPQQIGQQKKQVILNDGIDNNLSLLRAQVAIQPIQTSSGYKQHTHQRVTAIMDKLPEDLKGVLLPFWLDSSEMPKKEAAIKLINQKLGYEEDEDKRLAMEEQQVQEAQEAADLEKRTINAEIQDKEASSRAKDSQAIKNKADAIKTRIETAQLLKAFKTTDGENGESVPASSQQGLNKPQQARIDPPAPQPPGASGVN